MSETASFVSNPKAPAALKPGAITLASQPLNPTRIKIVGIGGGGGNAINRMIALGIKGVEFVAINTDLQDLRQKSKASHLLQIGEKIQKGLGAGADPEVGKLAAEEQTSAITELLQNTDLVFLTAGLGGGTGTGATPVVAKIAKKLGCLTVAVVTTPFAFEGAERMEKAQAGLAALRKQVDTNIVIPNENLFHFSQPEPLTIEKAFALVDSVLFKAIKGISDLIVKAGFINVDFADVRSVMRQAGNALISFTEVKATQPLKEVVDQLIHNPLTQQGNIRGAKGILLNVTYGKQVTIQETAKLIQALTKEISPQAKCIQGWALDEALNKEMKLTVIATGFSAAPSPKPTINPSPTNASQAAPAQAVPPPSAEAQAPESQLEQEPSSGGETTLFSSSHKSESFFPGEEPEVSSSIPELPQPANGPSPVAPPAASSPAAPAHVLKVDPGTLAKHTPFQEERIEQPYEGTLNNPALPLHKNGVDFNSTNFRERLEEDYLEQPAYLRRKAKL